MTDEDEDDDDMSGLRHLGGGEGAKARPVVVKLQHTSTSTSSNCAIIIDAWRIMAPICFGVSLDGLGNATHCLLPPVYHYQYCVRGPAAGK